MKLPNVSHFLSLSFAVMLLLSAGVQPVMAADAAKKQLDSFSFNDMNAIAIDEMRSDSASGSISFSSLSVDEDLLEFQQGKIHIRAKDPMADLHSSDAGEYSASSAGTTDPVDVRIAIVIANLSREGYVPLGNTEHQYLVTIESDKFRNLQGTQQALLKSQGLQVNSGGNASISALGKTNYFFFTNLTTNINRTVVAEQMVKNDGSPIGSMKVVVLEELAESYNDQMRGMEVSGSGYISASSADDKKMPLEEDHFWRNWGWGAAVAAVGFGILIVATGPVAIVVGGLICTAGISYLYYLSLTSSNPTITPTSTIPVPPPDSTVISFGDTSTLTKWPSGTDYSRLGGSSAIRRDGSLDTFVGAVALSGTDWVQATYGAAINKEGTLVTWTPGSSAISTTYLATADKKYVAVSRFSEGDWLLAITEDAAGETHLELVIEGDKTKHPEISDQLPTGTGWMKISAGNNHALALKSDRNLVAWGKNTYKQLELPADKKYTDIAAGRDFSLGLVETGTSTDTGPDLMVVAKGWDDDGQVRDMQALPVGRYITIEAGTTRSAAVDHDGTIRRGGKAWTGSQLPQGNGYTDIALGP
ncbi:MAG: RCC1 domain-containing protein, partial [Methanoregula sp.]|nr:RCC1 domain-containing protein [Methanoregula sp.]